MYCKYLFYSIAFSICYASPKVQAQSSNTIDTVRLNIADIEKRFLDSNLLLLASHYNVDAQKALIEQAKKWDNPVLNTDQVIAANGKFFPYGKNPDGSYSGQYYIQVQQLIRTAGKRSKLVDMATTNSKISELQLQDVLRSLRYQLHIDFYTLYKQLETLAIYLDQVTQLNKLLSGMDAQLKAGNIAQKDQLRIQALLISQEQDITELNRSISDVENDLKTLLQIKEHVFVKPVGITISSSVNGNLMDTSLMYETGKKNNPYYQIQQSQTLFQQQNLSYQKALRVPDLTLGPNFDRNSSFAPNYFGLGISLPLPILNNNKGNIKSAEYTIKQQQTLTMSAESELRNNIENAYNKLLLSIKQENGTQKEFYTKYRSMYQNILQSYQQRQINLLEFLDFYSDYSDSQQRLIQQHLNLQIAKEELNYHTGTDIIK